MTAAEWLHEMDEQELEAQRAAKWYLAAYYLLDGGCDTCQACGHEIKHVFVIRNHNGAAMNVGSECVNSWLAPDERNKAELIERRTNRAAAQWRKKDPQPRDGETRTDYINRRVAEMDNAMKAAKVWAGSFARMSLHSLAGHNLKSQGIEDPYHRRFSPHTAGEFDLVNEREGHEGKHSVACPMCQKQVAERDAEFAIYRDAVQTEIERITTEFEAKHNANRYDFQRVMWQVRKI